MTPEAFVAKWGANARNEAAASKEHFLDLCQLLCVPGPNSDPTGAAYAFEKGATKATGGRGWADVWKRGCFGWEYKSRGEDLEKAHLQLLRYAGALENPPLLVTCDMDRLVVRTNWTNAVSERHEFSLLDLREGPVRARLRQIWTDPEAWRPQVTRQALTERAAAEFAELAGRLRARGHDPQGVAHFVIRLVFCLFADDVDLLPRGLFERMLGLAAQRPGNFAPLASDLFRAMKDPGGRVGYDPVRWFNGGLFDDDTALPIEADDVALLSRTAALDWAEIDPSILGTLFERGLDPSKRGQLGAHYTGRATIEQIVEPVVLRPLLAEWRSTRARIASLLEKRRQLLAAEAAGGLEALAGEAITAEARQARAAMRRGGAARTKKANALRADAETTYAGFLRRLRAFRVLDPACGSGNFLYVSLLQLKDLEARVSAEAEALGLPPSFPEVGPEAVLGIEVNSYAAELARVSVWIGHIQWSRRNGYPPPENPVLRKLDTVDCRDALLRLAPDGAAEPAVWPDANVVVGNPPFLGDRKIIGSLGDEYATRLRRTYSGRVPAGADLVMYWVHIAGAMLAAGRAERVGLVTTNSIRGGQNREVLKAALERAEIFEAWSDQEWTLDGANVRVSIVCLRPREAAEPSGAVLDGRRVARVHADLTAAARGQQGADLTQARTLAENRLIAFQGIIPRGSFTVPGNVARSWMELPPNPNGRSNAEILRPYWNGLDITRVPGDDWIIDFTGMGEREASLFEAPFEHLKAVVRPERQKAREAEAREAWWLWWNPRPEMRRALQGLTRYLATPRVAKHRVWVWMRPPTLPDCQIVAIAADDDATFGLLQSRVHTIWTLRMCSWLGVGNDPRYTPKSVFRTFPFPEDYWGDRSSSPFWRSPEAMALATAARELDELRSRWLTAEGEKRQRRTMTSLYNAMPTWLTDAHCRLDDAALAAYGLRRDLSDDEVAAELLTMNLARSAPATRIAAE